MLLNVSKCVALKNANFVKPVFPKDGHIWTVELLFQVTNSKLLVDIILYLLLKNKFYLQEKHWQFIEKLSQCSFGSKL